MNLLVPLVLVELWSTPCCTAKPVEGTFCARRTLIGDAMHRLTVLCLCVLAAALAAQALAGTIRGTLRDSDGPVADATVQARDAATGALHETTSDAAGYTLDELPAGTYEIVVPPLGFRTAGIRSVCG